MNHNPTDPYTGGKNIRTLRAVYIDMADTGRFIVDYEDGDIRDKDNFEEKTVKLLDILKNRNSPGAPASGKDFNMKFSKPARIVFYVAAAAWAFGEVAESGDPGFQFVRNSGPGFWPDNDTFFALQRVSFLDPGKAITLINSCENDGPGVPVRKYEYKLHIDVSQEVGGQQVTTRLVIDPIIENDGGG